MPAKSRAQFNFMQMLAHRKGGDDKDGPSKSQAKEFVAGQSPKGLPERIGKDKDDKKPKRRKRLPMYPRGK